MKLHEFQAKEVFSKHGLKIPNGIPAYSPEDVAQAVQRLESALPNLKKVVVKSQVHVGGRGKAGGVKVVDK
ncbi:MAG: ATP-grasp domain-containing protein, partial [Candidatus Sericytochromatia bacterium]